MGGRPLAVASDAQVLPPSVERNIPLPLGEVGPSPPERNVQPLRRKSHIPASRTSGFFGSMVTLEQPVDGFDPLSASAQVFPPSLVLYRPRSVESLHSLPGTQA